MSKDVRHIVADESTPELAPESKRKARSASQTKVSFDFTLLSDQIARLERNWELLRVALTQIAEVAEECHERRENPDGAPHRPVPNVLITPDPPKAIARYLLCKTCGARANLDDRTVPERKASGLCSACWKKSTDWKTRAWLQKLERSDHVRHSRKRDLRWSRVADMEDADNDNDEEKESFLTLWGCSRHEPPRGH